MSTTSEGLQAIDTHTHFVPQSVLRTLEARASDFGIRLDTPAGGTIPAVTFDYGLKVRPFFPKLVESVEERLAGMDRMGVGHAVLSQWTDIFGYGLPTEQGVAWHRLMNEGYQELCAAHGKRFSYLASMPLSDAEVAASEAEHAVLSMGAVGLCVAANVEEVNLGELDLDPLWAVAERLNVPVMIHPVQAMPGPRVKKFALTQIVQYPFDTTLAIGSMIGSGVFDRFPGLKIYIVHGGGLLPYLLGRFDRLYHSMNREQQGYTAQHPASHYLGNLYVDTIVHHSRTLNFLNEMVPEKNLVLGSDYSFPPADMTPVDTVAGTGLPVERQREILWDNALDLFPRLRTQLGIQA